MKNVTLSINPNAISNFAPQPQSLNQQPLAKIILVSFSAQFDNESEAMKFARNMLVHMQNFNSEND